MGERLGLTSFEILLRHVLYIDNMSASPRIPEERDVTGVPVTCSKCNELFESESDYVVHYNAMHAATGPE
jgi:hypothetical protein